MGRHGETDLDKYSDGDYRRGHRRSRSQTPDSDLKRSRKHDRSRSRSRERDGRKEKRRKRDKSAERKARKAEKKRLREEEEAKRIAELSVYGATDNPFNDANLGQQFRWHKKAEKDRSQGISRLEAERRDAIRRQEAQEELERLNKRRADREVEARIREEQELQMQRLQENAQMSEWIAKEDDFTLEQERTRAFIRIKEKRAKAVDFLCLNLRYINPPSSDEETEEEDAALEIDLDEPYKIYENLTTEQIEELHDDIQHYLQLEKSKVNIDFWTNMMIVCQDRLEKIRTDQKLGVQASAAVEADIAALLSGKTYEQLMGLQKQVQDKLTSGEPVDTDYWEGLLKQLVVWKAKSKLKSLHEVVIKNRLEQLRKRERDEALHARVSTSVAEPTDTSVTPDILPSTSQGDIDIGTAKEALQRLLEDRRTAASTAGSEAAGTLGVDTSLEQRMASSNADIASEALYRAEAERELDEEEELFNLEEKISRPTSYQWEDKYRPRKPRYFNRVHTGYEWNKYNQTHYDLDNPPPKVVQGYKFNIFYPDLIDKSKAPTYKIIEEPGNDDTCLLLFQAGPPYEDIAFRIVRRDWEYSHRRGFKSTFDRGCLSLWFQFRRNFYRK